MEDSTGKADHKEEEGMVFTTLISSQTPPPPQFFQKIGQTPFSILKSESEEDFHQAWTPESQHGRSVLYQINDVEQKESLRSQSLSPELLRAMATRTELEKLNQLLRLEREPLGKGASPERLPEDNEEELEEREIREDDLGEYHSFEERSKENSKDEENILLRKDPVHTTPQTSVKIIRFSSIWIQLSSKVEMFYSWITGDIVTQKPTFKKLLNPAASQNWLNMIRKYCHHQAMLCAPVDTMEYLALSFINSWTARTDEGPQTMDDYAVYHDGARVVGEMITVKICEDNYSQGSAVAEQRIEGDLATLLEDSSIELGPVQHKQELP
ncbi:hypothetical protein C8J56DRAFT_893306 [Mycena floridula]|nr:hypothetical protein C8J56DRAFT_893306 [Mycena floridula]